MSIILAVLELKFILKLLFPANLSIAIILQRQYGSFGEIPYDIDNTIFAVIDSTALIPLLLNVMSSNINLFGSGSN